jgi:hypothetical protein
MGFQHLQFGHSRTPEACWEISQGYAFFAYPWIRFHDKWSRTPKGVADCCPPFQGGFFNDVFEPVVRKERVLLAKFPAPLRGTF